MVEGFLDSSGVVAAPDGVRCVLVPHAGYIYSALTAAHAYARVRGKRVGRVILLGCSHRYSFDGMSAPLADAFATPLGSLRVDRDFIRELPRGKEDFPGEPHDAEHSLEVQLPFLQVALGDVPFVPILFGGPFTPWHDNFARHLAASVEKDDLVVVSTDLSHYLTEAEANALDKQSLDTLLTQDVAAVLSESAKVRCTFCGVTAVATGMAYCQAVGANAWTLLDYRTSAAASGDTGRVVGYAALSMEDGG
jgi:hypothetical protein